MKKLGALIILCLFLLSVVSVVHAQSQSNETQNTSSALADEQKACSATGGKWTTLPSACLDFCSVVTHPDTACAAVISQGCDCDSDKCWDGIKCVPNPGKNLEQKKPTEREGIPEKLQKIREPLKDRISDLKKLENLKEHELEAIEKTNRKHKDKLDNLEKENLEKFSRLPPGIAKKILEDGKFEKLLEKLEVKLIAKEDLQNAFVKRVIEADKIKVAEENFRSAKEKLETIKADYKEKKVQFKKTKKLEDAKAYFLKVIDSAAERINKIKARVESSKHISEERAKEILSDLDSRIVKLNDWKSKIEAAKTKADMKPISKEIRAGLKDLNHMLNFHGLQLTVQHFGGILRQAEQLDSKLNRWLAFAEKNNITISDKDAKVASFEEKLADARKSHEAIRADYIKLKELVGNKTENLTDPEAADRKAIEGSIQNNLKAGKKSLREARDIFVGLVKDMLKEVKEKKPVSRDGKLIELKEEAALDPTKTVEGVDIGEGENTVAVLQDTQSDL